MCPSVRNVVSVIDHDRATVFSSRTLVNDGVKSPCANKNSVCNKPAGLRHTNY